MEEILTRSPLAADQYATRPRTYPSLTQIFESEELSRGLLEDARWPEGPQCLRCQAKNAACKLTTRPGLWTCKACRNCQYSVTSGTPLHGTRVNLSHWLILFHAQEIRHQRLSVSQVSRRLGVGYLTAKSMIARLDMLRAEMPEIAERLKARLLEIAGNREAERPLVAPARETVLREFAPAL